MDELKIIKYLDGEMSEVEIQAFEEEIRLNSPLAEELERYRQIQDLARKLLDDSGSPMTEERNISDPGGKFPDVGDQVPDPAVEKEISDAVRDYKKDPESFDRVSPEYRRELDAAQKSYLGQRDRKVHVRVIGRIWFRAAAIIMLALILSILIFRPFSGGTPDEIYARYNRPFQRTDQVMEMARNDNDFLFAVEVYEAGDFDRAVVLFGMLADGSVNRAWSLFYAGNSNMSLNQSSAAIELFREVLLEGNDAVIPHAHWQIALCYIRTGEPALAREHLEMLAKDPVYRRDAKRIMRIVY